MMGGDCKCNFKNWVLTSFIIAILYLGLDMFFNHVCLMKLYQSNMQYFRTMDDMMKLRGWGYLGYLVFGAFFSCIYSKGYESGKSKAGQGLRFGFLMGLFYWGAGLLGMYPYFPWPNPLYISWFVVGLFEFTVLGFVLGMIFKPKQA